MDGKVAKRIAAMRAAVEDDVPEAWLSDHDMEGYNPEYHGFITSIEEGLLAALHKSDAAAAAAFIKDGFLRMSVDVINGWIRPTSAPVVRKGEA